MDLTGRVALVTGASAGLGVHFARTLARAGASVVVVARRIEKLNGVVADLVAQGGRAAAVALDVGDADAIRPALDAAEAHFGRIDILVNNAATSQLGRAESLDLDTVSRIINVNFRAPFVLATEVARRLIAAEQRGWIVNLSSLVATSYRPDMNAVLYSATKAGVIRMTEALALEWAKFGINVNAIAPGMFRSEMSQAVIDRAGPEIARNFPRKRIGDAEYLESTLLYLVSPSSHFVTGVCISVDDAQYGR